MASALDREEVVVELADRLLASDAELPVYHFLYAHVAAAFSADRRLAGLVTRFGEKLLELMSRSWTAARVADAYLHQGSISDALRVLEAHGDLDDPSIAERVARLESLERLRERGFDYQPASPEQPYRGLPGQVMFVLHHSSPFHSNGYATRGHGLLAAINQRDWNVMAVTRMGYPLDLPKFADIEFRRCDVVEGVEYQRIRGPGAHLTPLCDYLQEFADRLVHVACKHEPEIFHAHSNALVGLVANRAARALGIPSIYEIRGLWEVTRASRQPGFAGTEYYELLHEMEVTAAQEADAVICITQALADEMVRCGVDRDKISIVPNGVDVERFRPRPRDRALERELGLTGKRVIGYVGSVVDYEGLDDLLRATRILIDRGRDDVAVLIVGDGASLDGLRTDVRDLGLDAVVTFTGRVPHSDVERYYSLIDIAPFPRKSLPVTEMVSPLKPFEAMAMDKIIVASDVAALAEIITDGVNGFLFAKDDPEALAAALERALGALEPGARSGLSPRAWVSEHRSWSEMAARLEAVYQRVSDFGSRPEVVDLANISLPEPVVAVCDAYVAHHGEADTQPLRPDDYARLSLVLARLPSGTSILDVGVAGGQFLNIVGRAGRFRDRRGVDVERHPSFVTFGEPFPVDYLSVESLPYGDGEFDVVTCLEVIEHLDAEIFERGISELRRVCGKQLVITVPFRERVLAEDHKRRFDVEDLERLFPRAGLTIMRKVGSQLGRPAYWALVEETQ
jgi:PEP-CTERM/exosortase A-associated glycosyltransferase